MATFSSFVDLENQSVIIQQPDPTTLYSIVRHHATEIPPSASPNTIEQMKTSITYKNILMILFSQHQRTPTPTKTLMIEKRDGFFSNSFNNISKSRD